MIRAFPLLLLLFGLTPTLPAQSARFAARHRMIEGFASAVNLIEFLDCDGDGDLDLLLGGWTGQASRLFINLGDAVLVEAPGALPSTVQDAKSAAACADFNGDGNPDLVVGNERESDYVLENDGSGSFLVVIPTLSANHQTRSLGGGDLDGDGDWDVVIGSRWMYTAEILFNGLRQASWLGLPRFGKPLKIVLDGPPGETWYLFASGATGQLPLPPFGTVGLDRGGIVFLGNGLLDNFGRGAWSAAMPPNPGGLAGLTGYVQAVVGFHQPRLTNVEPLVLTDF